METPDNHTHYIKCTYATEKQIYDVYNEGLTKYQKDNKLKEVDRRFKVNYITNKEGEPLGVAFAFLTDSTLYHMILGRNPDGTERYIEQDDPSWKPPSKDDLVNESGWSMTSKYDKGMSWADVTEEDEKMERKFVCPKIRTLLPPLITIPPVRLTDVQMEEKRQDIIEENEGKLGFDPSKVHVPREEYLSIDEALSKPKESKFLPNVLKATNVADWVTARHIKIIFTPYVTDAVTPDERVVHGVTVREPYPHVNISEKDGKRCVFVVFDPQTTNAYFALHMQMKTTVRDKIDNVPRLCVLIFHHAYKGDRDMMTEINKRPHQGRPDGYRGGRGESDGYRGGRGESGSRGGSGGYSRGESGSRGGSSSHSRGGPQVNRRGSDGYGRGGLPSRSDGHVATRFSALTEGTNE